MIRRLLLTIAITLAPLCCLLALDHTVENFDGTNWGGYTIDSAAPGASATVGYSALQNHTPVGANSYHIQWSGVDASGEWAGGVLGGLSVDVSTYNALSFWIYTPNANTDLEIQLQDQAGFGSDIGTVSLKDYVTTTVNNWQSVIIPLAAFTRSNQNLDLKIGEIKWIAVADKASDTSGDIFVDDIQFCIFSHAPARSKIFSGGDKGLANSADIPGDTIIWWDQALSSVTCNEVSVRVSTGCAAAWASVPSDQSMVNTGTTVYFAYQIRNDGNAADTLYFSTQALTGNPNGTQTWPARIYRDRDRSGTFTAGDTEVWNSVDLMPESTYYFLAGVLPAASTVDGASTTVRVTARDRQGTGAEDSWLAAGNDTINDSFTLTATNGHAVTLVAAPGDQSLLAGATAYYAYAIRNDGTADDTFTLSASTTAGDNWLTALYSDDNADSVFDAGETTPMTTTGVLARGATSYFFVAVFIPSGAGGGSATVTLTVNDQNGAGTNDNWPTGANDDTLTDAVLTTATAPRYSIVSLFTPGDQSLLAGSTAYYAYAVRNNGNTSDVFTVAASTTAGGNWPVRIIRDTNANGVHEAGETTLIANTGSLAGGATAYFFVAVTIPNGATGSATAQLTIKNQNGAGTNDNWPTAADDDTITDTTITSETPAGYSVVLISLPNDQTTYAAGSASTLYYAYTVRNNGNTNDTFTLSASTVAGINWPVSLIRDDNADGVHQAGEVTGFSSTSSIASGADAFFFITVTVPGGASGTATVQLTVKDQNGAGTNDNYPTTANDDTLTHTTLTTVVPPRFSIVLANPPSDQLLVPGATAYYSYAVRNNGNVTDLFALSTATVSGGPWPIRILRDDNADGVHNIGETTAITDTGNLASGATACFFVAVTVPAGASNPSTVRLTIKDQSGTGTNDNWPTTTDDDTISDDTLTTPSLDTSAPVITVLIEPPSEIGMLGNKLEFSSRIDDPESTLTPALIYWINGGTPLTVAFSTTTDNIYTSDIMNVITGCTLSYYWRAVNVVGYTTVTSTRTITITQTTSAPGTTAGSVTVPDGNPSDGFTGVEIPPGALDRPITVSITQLDNTAQPPAGPPADYPLPSSVFEFAPDGVIFKLPVKVTQLYRDLNNDGFDDVSGKDERTMRLFWWDGFEWRLIGGTVDPVNNTVSAYVMHFCRFGVFPVGTMTSASYRPKERIVTPAGSPGKNDFVQFPVSGDFTIRIYDVNGALVRTLNGGVNIWRGEDDSGKIVESGVYIYQLHSPEASVSGTLLVAK